MVGKKCPMLKSICIESNCEWFLRDARECAIVSLGDNLWMVTQRQFGDGALKVIQD